MENLKHTETNLNITNMQQSAASYYKRCSIAFFALTVISGAVLGALAGKQILTGKTLAALALPGFLAVGSGVALLQKRNSQKIIDILQDQQERSQQLESLKHQQLTEKNQQLTDIKNKINTLTSEKESLNDQIYRLKQDTQTNKELVSSLNNEIQEKQKNIEKLKKENERLRSSSKLSEAEQKKLLKNKEAESKLTDEIKKLEEQSENLSSRLKGRNQQVKELTEEIAKKEQFIQEQKTNHQTELQKLKQESTAKESQLNTQLKYLKQEKNQNEEKLQHVQNNLNKLKTQLQSLKNDKNQSESNLKLNKDKIKNLENKLKESQDKNNSILIQEKKKLEIFAETTKKEKQALEEKITNLEKDISEIKKRSNDLKETIENQKTQLNTLNNKIQQLSKENDSLKQIKKNLEQNIGKIKSQITELKEERDSQIAELKKTHKNQIDNIINRRKESSTQTDSQQIIELTKKNNALIAEIKINYNSKITELSEVVKKLENERSKLSEQLQISKGANEKLKKQLKEEQEINENAINSLIYLENVIALIPQDQHSHVTSALALQINIKNYFNEIQSRKKEIKLNENQEKSINNMIAEFQSIGLDLNNHNQESLSNFSQENITKGIELLSKISYELEKANFENTSEELYKRFELTYETLNKTAKAYEDDKIRSIDDNKEYQSILEQAHKIEQLFNPKMEEDFEKLASQRELSEGAGKLQKYDDRGNRGENLNIVIETIQNELSEFTKRVDSFEQTFMKEEFYKELNELRKTFTTLSNHLPENTKLTETNNETELEIAKKRIKSYLPSIKEKSIELSRISNLRTNSDEHNILNGIEFDKELYEYIKLDIINTANAIEKAKTVDELLTQIIHTIDINDLLELRYGDTEKKVQFNEYVESRKKVLNKIATILNNSNAYRLKAKDQNDLKIAREGIKKLYKTDDLLKELEKIKNFIESVNNINLQQKSEHSKKIKQIEKKRNELKELQEEAIQTINKKLETPIFNTKNSPAKSNCELQIRKIIKSIKSSETKKEIEYLKSKANNEIQKAIEKIPVERKWKAFKRGNLLSKSGIANEKKKEQLDQIIDNLGGTLSPDLIKKNIDDLNKLEIELKKEQKEKLENEKEKIIKEMDDRIASIIHENQLKGKDIELIETIQKKIRKQPTLEQLNDFCENDIDYNTFKEAMEDTENRLKEKSYFIKSFW